MNGTYNHNDKPAPPGAAKIPPLWILGGILVLVVLIALAVYIIYKFCCEDNGSQGGAKSKFNRHASKSVAVIVKVPSLADSVAPDLDLAESPHNDGSGSKSLNKKNLKKMESKSLKLAECNPADTKGKMSFKV